MDLKDNKLFNTALALSFVTISYNLIEGGLPLFFGFSYDALSLLGFGIDSFVEVLSGLGVAHMILRMKYSIVIRHDEVERLTLKVTGISFYILTSGFIICSILNLARHIEPGTTLPGLIVSLISIIILYILMRFKLKVAKLLKSDAIIADTH
jgi:divalent metal cation (Fe/Co/Zn/Cd) transporter